MIVGNRKLWKRERMGIEYPVVLFPDIDSSYIYIPSKATSRAVFELLSN